MGLFRTRRALLPGLIATLLALICLPTQAAPLIVTLTTAQTTGANPLTYYNGLLLQMALEKTRAEYGDFQIETTPLMNTARALEDIKNNIHPNQLIVTTFQNRILDQELDYARFPVDYGVTGYRICFVSPQAKAKAVAASSLDALRQLNIAQGIGWADVAILRHNQFKVVEVGDFENAFRMVAAGRVDLFCRGINELQTELLAHPEVSGLDYDHSFALAYNLPRFFVFSRKNSKPLERITKGLQKMHQDGSLRKLWLEQYGEALRFANMKQRKIFQLQTPNIDRIDFDYRQYYIDPQHSQSYSKGQP